VASVTKYDFINHQILEVHAEWLALYNISIKYEWQNLKKNRNAWIEVSTDTKWPKNGYKIMQYIKMQAP